MSLVLSNKESSDDADSALQTSQVVILTRAETEFIIHLGEKTADTLAAAGVTATKPAEVKKHAPLESKDVKAILPALPASLDTALFGRMVTSDLFHRVDAAVSVAHAFTTHAEEAETDYFTAVDTLKDADDDAGAGTIQDTELTTGVYYLYAVIDMEQLRANLVGYDDAFAERLACNLVRTMATVSPGAKRGSTAPYAYAELVLLERGTAQPRTLANAFLQPLRVAAPTHGAVPQELVGYRTRLAAMHGVADQTVVLATVTSSTPRIWL